MTSSRSVAPRFVEPLQAMAAEGLCRLADPESAESFRWEHMERLLFDAYAAAVRGERPEPHLLETAGRSAVERARPEDGNRPQSPPGEAE